MPTITDVAREAGVSTASVSLVLNNPSTTRVGAAKRKEVLRVASKIGYSPNLLAKGLAKRSTGILGLLVPMRDPIFFNHFIAEVLSGIQSCLIERGYHLMIYSHIAKSGKISRGQILESRFADGLIIINTRMCTAANMEATIEELNTAGVPFVMANSYYGHQALNYVGVDDREIGYTGGAYLLRKGHRRIALLGGAHRSPMSGPMLDGLQQALTEGGTRLDPALMAYGEYQRERIYEVTSGWLKRRQPPTAIFCACDQMVPEVYDVVEAAGLSIPKDIAILGRGGLGFTSLLRPKLSTVRVPTMEMGRHAAELLVGSIQRPGAHAQRILLPCSLIERESV